MKTPDAASMMTTNKRNTRQVLATDRVFLFSSMPFGQNKNQAFRYVSNPEHAALIRPYGWLYSTSANKSGERYDPSFCHHAADWIIEDYRTLHEAGASRIYKLGRTRLVRVR